MKQCNTCGKTKEFESFASHISTKDGYRGHCRPCGTIKTSNYRKTGKTYANGFEGKTIEA